MLAVSAPGREELDQDQGELIDSVLKSLISEDKHVALNLILIADSVIVVMSIMVVIVIVVMVVVLMIVMSVACY